MSTFLWFILIGLGAVASPLTLFAGVLHVWAYIRFGDRVGFRVFHVLTAVGFAITTGAITVTLIREPIHEVDPRPIAWVYAVGLASAAIGTIGLTREAINIYVNKEAAAKEEGL